MPRLSANVSMLFTEVPFIERFAQAAACGFKGVECQFPYDHEPAAFADAVAMSEAKLVLFNAPAGDTANGERGFAAVPGRKQEFRESLDTVRRYIELTECPRVHIMAGRIDPGTEGAEETFLDNLAYAADELRKDKVKVVIEAINMEGYYLRKPSQAVEILRRLEHPNVGLLYDLYHAQTQEGDLTEFIDRNLELIDHIQIAGVPGRHEPDRHGEINWRFLFDGLDAHGYEGWVGAEYQPRHGTIPGLGWASEWGIAPPSDNKKQGRR